MSGQSEASRAYPQMREQKEIGAAQVPGLQCVSRRARAAMRGRSTAPFVSLIFSKRPSFTSKNSELCPKAGLSG